MSHSSKFAAYLLTTILCIPPAWAETAIPKLWLASGIPQRVQERNLRESERWGQKHENGNGLRLPNVVDSREKCFQTEGPAYSGVVDLANGYLQLTRCIPEETMNDTDTITTAQFLAANREPVFISTNKGGAMVEGNPIHTISSNKPVRELLPRNFSIMSFARPGTEIDTNGLIAFYLDLELPRHGTEVLAHIRLMPIGLKVQNNSPVIDDHNRLTTIWPGDYTNDDDFERTVPFVANDDKTMFLSAMLAPYFERDEVLPGVEQVNMLNITSYLGNYPDGSRPQKPWPAMGEAEKLELAEYLAANLSLVAHQERPQVYPSYPVITTSGLPDDARAFFMEQIEYMHMLERAWNKLEWETLALGWDKARARFYIKGGHTPARKAKFISRVIPADLSAPAFTEEFFEWAWSR